MKRLALFLSTLTVSTALSGLALADNLGFTNAKPWLLGDRDCFFAGSYAAIFNTCDPPSGGPRKVLLAAPQRSTGAHTFKATAANSGGGGFSTSPQCRAVLNAENNSFINQTAFLFLSAAGVKTTLGTMTVSAGQAQHFDCDVYGGSLGPSNAEW
jgi:hypothetical protein